MLTQGDALLKATAKASFWQSYEGYPSITAGITASVTSDSVSEEYPWLAYAPGVKEMVGSRVKRSVPEYSYTIKNKKWENTVSVAYETRKFAKLNQVQALLGNLGAKARAYPDKLVSLMIDNGYNTAGYTSYNGLGFFHAAQIDPGAAYTASQVNYIDHPSATGTLWTDAEAAGAINAARAKLMTYKDGDGDPVYMDPSKNILIMCHPNIYSKLAPLRSQTTLAGGVSNPVLGSFDIVPNPWLTPTTTVDNFYAFNVSGAHKPFVLQTAEAVSLEDDMGGDNDFNTKDVSFGSFGYYNAGYGDWRYGVKVITS